MRLADVVSASASVAATSGRLEKIGHLAELLVRTPPDQLAIVIPFLSGSTRQGRIGIGGAALHALHDVPPATSADLAVADVDAVFDRIAATSGAPRWPAQ
jgi:DNA ligase-1